MNTRKSHGNRKNSRDSHAKNDNFTINNIQVKCKSEMTGGTIFLTDNELKKYHDIHVKLNKLHENDKIIYYITEDDLNTMSDGSMQIHLKTVDSNDKIPDKTHSKIPNKFHNQDKPEEKLETDIKPNGIQSLVLLETLLAELTDFDNLPVQNKEGIKRKSTDNTHKKEGHTHKTKTSDTKRKSIDNDQKKHDMHDKNIEIKLNDTIYDNSPRISVTPRIHEDSPRIPITPRINDVSPHNNSPRIPSTPKIHDIQQQNESPRIPTRTYDTSPRLDTKENELKKKELKTHITKREHFVTVPEKQLNNAEINIDSLAEKNIEYDINDTEEYDIFIITNAKGKESYLGMPPKSISTMSLMERRFIGKVFNYELNDGTNVVFLIYSAAWPQYTFPVYIIIHNYKFTTKKFITLFNTIIGLVV